MIAAPAPPPAASTASAANWADPANTTADITIGDRVVTSGIDGIYPKGFVIGTIDRVERGPGTYHEIRVRPAVDFSRLEEVLVVLTPAPGRAAGEAKDQP